MHPDIDFLGLVYLGSYRK